MVSYQDDDRSYKVRRRFCFVVFQIALLCHTAVLGFSTLPSAIVQRSNNNNKFQYVSSGGSLADQHSCIRISVNLRASEEKEDEKERIKKSNQDSTAINTATDDTEGFSSDEAGENFSSKQNQLEQRPSSQPPEPTRDIRTEDLMAAMGTNPRRIFVGLLSGTGIALAGNFLGVTSKFLTALPESTVEASGLDTYFPRGDYKRVKGRGYTFVIPKEWVGDTFVELAKAQRQTKPLDLNMGSSRRMGGSTTLPDSAFGPPGRLNPRTGVSEQGDTNVSVIVSGGLVNFSLKGTLGTPTNAAETFLRLSLAPEGSGRTATLISAEEDTEREVYQFKYDVDRGPSRPPLRAISAIAAGKPAGSTLLTLTVTAPKESWEGDSKFASKLEKIASTFHTT